ncbi:MAG TPA: penicillin-binding protein activator [Usitatibacter sp.]|nr:penicillin-binding protein activator [Usitatibacter sp.]
MSRLTALLFLALASWVSPAFSADPPAGTTFPPQDIDPATGLSRSSVVRPLRDVATVPDPRRSPPAVRRPHIALILPTSSQALGRLAEAVRQGFTVAAEVAGKEAPPLHVTAIENEGQGLVDACLYAQSTGALLVVGGLTRDGATAMVSSDCARRPVLALNEARAEGNPNVFSISLSLEHEARQAALLAVESGLRSAIVIHTPSPISRRVQEAFEREWTRAAGETRRILYSGKAEEAALIRERIANSRGDMVFFALDYNEALAVRPYVSAMLPVYATSLSVNPRADPLVNLDLQGLRYVEMPWFIHPDHPAVMVYPQPKEPQNVEQERLYALGIDAFRLALLLVKGEAAKLGLDGVTGKIALEPGNHFSRQLSPAEVDGGRVIPLRP